MAEEITDVMRKIIDSMSFNELKHAHSRYCKMTRARWPTEKKEARRLASLKHKANIRAEEKLAKKQLPIVYGEIDFSIIDPGQADQS